MRFMIFIIPAVRHGEERNGAGRGFIRPADAAKKIMKFNEALAKAGHLISLDALHPIDKGVRVSFDNGEQTVTDGRFINSKEAVGGYWMTNFSSKEEAIEWAKRIPALDGDTIEIRQVFDPEDFPENVICPVFSGPRQ